MYRQGIINGKKEDIYLGVVPNHFVLALCSSEGFNGSFSKTPFNFYHYNLDCLNVTVNGTPTPSESLRPDFQQGDYTSCYLTLFDQTQKQSGLISEKDYPNGYCIFVFRIQSQCGGDLYSREKEGNLRIKLKFAEALKENVTVILYAEFPQIMTINGSRNIDLVYKS